MGRKPEVPAKDQVRNEVIRAGSEGIFQRDVIKSTKLGRDTVYVTAKELQREGQIRIERVGQRAKYFVMVKALENLQDISFLFPLYACRGILSRTVAFTVADNGDDEKIGRPLLNDSPFVYRPATEGKDDPAFDIFDFSVRVGAIITYIILQAISEIHSSHGGAARPSSVQKDILAEHAVSRLVSEMIPRELLRQFIIWFNGYDEAYQLEHSFGPRLPNEASIYEFYEPVTRQFLDAFSRAFPVLYKTLDKVKNEVSKEIEKEKRLIMQGECDHAFDTRKLLSEGRILFRKCSKCDFEESVAFRPEKKDKDT